MFNAGISFIFDPLSIFFIFTILTIAFPVFIYSFGYLQGHYSPKKIVLGQFLLFLFIASMIAVVCAGNAFIFLVAWELMSMLSYFLVIFDSSNKKSIFAGMIYIVMTHIGTAFLLAAFFLMYKHCNSFDFLAMKDALVTASPNFKNMIFLLLLAGFGTKAGIVPLHIWLPYAHPQAPSHVSALMSGVMIKTAVYGLIRFVIIILGVQSLYWGGLVMGLASISALVGIIYALMEKDIKTLLAYSSVENMGIILLGVGASMVFIKAGLPTLAVLAMAAGLFHLINHAIFKSLLFLCAGSVYKSCGTRNMEKLGGLINKLKWTSACFLLGALAISAIPPFNGFASEWLTLQTFFWGALSLTGKLKLLFAFSAAVLALAGGLAAACFVKAFGMTFLALPRSSKTENISDASFSMKFGMGYLGSLVIFFGIGAAYIIKKLTWVSGSIIGSEIPGTSFIKNNFVVAMPISNGIFLSNPLILSILLLAAAGTFAVVYLIWGRAKTTKAATWDCGYYKISSRNEYSATGFSKPFRLAFGFFLMPYKNQEKIKESTYYIKSFTYETHTKKIFKEFFYKPLYSIIFRASKSLRFIQAGSIHLYLGYIFVVLLFLLTFTGIF